MSTGIADAGRRAAGADKPVPLPAQALDHGCGFLLAAGACRALVRLLVENRASEVRLSLARTAKLLTDLGESGDLAGREVPAADIDRWCETAATAWGPIRRVRCPGRIRRSRPAMDDPGRSPRRGRGRVVVERLHLGPWIAPRSSRGVQCAIQSVRYLPSRVGLGAALATGALVAQASPARADVLLRQHLGRLERAQRGRRVRAVTRRHPGRACRSGRVPHALDALARAGRMGHPRHVDHAAGQRRPQLPRLRVQRAHQPRLPLRLHAGARDDKPGGRLHVSLQGRPGQLHRLPERADGDAGRIERRRSATCSSARGCRGSTGTPRRTPARWSSPRPTTARRSTTAGTST